MPLTFGTKLIAFFPLPWTTFQIVSDFFFLSLSFFVGSRGDGEKMGICLCLITQLQSDLQAYQDGTLCHSSSFDLNEALILSAK